MSSQSNADLRRELRNSLIAATLQHAATRVAAYRSRIGELAADIQSIDDLHRLPITTKAMMMVDSDSYRDPDLPTAVVQHTGGTTRQTLVLHRSGAELEYIHKFFTELASTQPDGQAVDAPLCISVLGHFHGDPTPIPYPAPVFSLNLSDPYWDLPTVASDPGKLLGVSQKKAVLVGLESQLRILTCRLIEMGYDFSNSCVTSLYSTGDLITRRLRSWYEETWRAPLINRYSMTELFGGANRCDECGYLHFDPHVVGEVVDPVSKQPVDRGYGVLVATCLYPFVQKQPIIRYWTGDLVQLGPTSCPVDRLAFAVKGRLSTCLIDSTPEGTQPLLASAEVYDALDDFPDVASSQMFRSISGVTDHSALGHLKLKLQREDRDGQAQVSLQVETRYTGYMYPAHTKRFCETVRARLLERHPWLQHRVDKGTARFEVTPVLPGTLDSFMPDETE